MVEELWFELLCKKHTDLESPRQYWCTVHGLSLATFYNWSFSIFKLCQPWTNRISASLPSKKVSCCGDIDVFLPHKTSHILLGILGSLRMAHNGGVTLGFESWVWLPWVAMCEVEAHVDMVSTFFPSYTPSYTYVCVHVCVLCWPHTLRLLTVLHWASTYYVATQPN